MKVQINELATMLNLVISFPECIAWSEFRDQGNPCVNWCKLPCHEALPIGTTRVCIEYIMPKYSTLFKTAQKRIAKELNCKTVTYDWTTKALARLLSGTNLVELQPMMLIARNCRAVLD